MKFLLTTAIVGHVGVSLAQAPANSYLSTITQTSGQPGQMPLKMSAGQMLPGGGQFQGQPGQTGGMAQMMQSMMSGGPMPAGGGQFQGHGGQMPSGGGQFQGQLGQTGGVPQMMSMLQGIAGQMPAGFDQLADTLGTLLSDGCPDMLPPHCADNALPTSFGPTGPVCASGQPPACTDGSVPTISSFQQGFTFGSAGMNGKMPMFGMSAGCPDMLPPHCADDAPPTSFGPTGPVCASGQPPACTDGTAPAGFHVGGIAGMFGGLETMPWGQEAFQGTGLAGMFGLISGAGTTGAVQWTQAPQGQPGMYPGATFGGGMQQGVQKGPVASATAPKAGSCAGKCNTDNAGGCFCDVGCAVYGDCCPDYTLICKAGASGSTATAPKAGASGSAPKAGASGSTATAPKAGSCAGKCNAGNAGGCYCDVGCAVYGDCCSDYTLACSGLPALPKAVMAYAGALGSCKGLCGKASFDCYCDPLCVGSGDCCVDYKTSC